MMNISWAWCAGDWWPRAMWLVVCSLGALSGCSLVEHWDEAGLACDSSVVDGRTNFCLDGYTCFNPSVTCIRDGSRNLGQACTDARQCQDDELCPLDNLTGTAVPQQDDVQTCLRKCHSASADGGYYQEDGCDTNYYCKPFLDGSASLTTSSIIGGCVPTTGCTPNTYCNIDNQAGGICVPISSSANACIRKCDITWASTATYSDNCGANQYCQPVGLAASQQFVCLDNTDHAVADNANCSLVEAPCKKGSVCSPQGTCAPYCELVYNSIANATVCGTKQTCCPFYNYGSQVASGYCFSGTVCPTAP